MPHKDRVTRLEYRRRWYSLNKERHRAAALPSILRRRSDPEYVAASRDADKKRYWKNPEKYRSKALLRYYNDHDKKLEIMRKRAKQNPGRARNQALKHKYGITSDEWEALFASQGRRCPSCNTDSPTGKRPWHVDHCHATGKIRAILCHGCNTALGLIKDNPDTLRSLADYVEKFKEDATTAT